MRLAGLRVRMIDAVGSDMADGGGTWRYWLDALASGWVYHQVMLALV